MTCHGKRCHHLVMARRLAIAVAGAILGVATLELVRAGGGLAVAGQSTGAEVLLLVVGWSLVVAAVATRRWLLAAAAVAWFVAQWAIPVAPPWQFTVGLVGYAAVPAVVLHFALARSRMTAAWPARVLVAGGYVIMLGLEGLGTAVVFDPAAGGCTGCPDNLVGIGHDPRIWADVSALALRVGCAWLALSLVVLAWWWIPASSVQRRDAGVVACAGAYLGLELAYYVHSFESGFLGMDETDANLWRYRGLALICLAAVTVLTAVRTRRTHRALTRLVSGLDAGDVATGLATRLRDPALAVGYPAADGTGWLNASGAAVALADGTDRVVTEVRRGSTTLAAVSHRRDLAPERVGEMATVVHLALDHHRLEAQALAQLADVRQAGVRIVAAGDAERRQLEHDLHDGAQQSLVMLLLGLRLARQRQDAPELAEAERLLESAVDGLREIAHGLYPLLLERAGLATALRALAETRPLRIAAVPDGRLPQVIESTVYLLVEQASRHNPATVRLHANADTVEIDIDLPRQPGQLDADRITTLDGELTIDTLGETTHVRATLPLAPP